MTIRTCSVCTICQSHDNRGRSTYYTSEPIDLKPKGIPRLEEMAWLWEKGFGFLLISEEISFLGINASQVAITNHQDQSIKKVRYIKIQVGKVGGRRPEDTRLNRSSTDNTGSPKSIQ